MKQSTRNKARKIEEEVQEGAGELKKGYRRVLRKIKRMNNTGLILLCIVGVAGIVYFENGLLNFLALIVFSYAFYVFASREGYRDGYYDAKDKADEREAADSK